MSDTPVIPSLDQRIAELRRLDSVDDSRRRLVSIRTRIETNWPSQGGLLRRGSSLDPATRATIADLLTALPSPLPLETGGEPVSLIKAGDVDLRASAGRAVDAAMVLLAGASLDTVYPGEITLFEGRSPGAAVPITLSDPTVGLLVAIIIATLEAISELIAQKPGSRHRAASKASPASPAKPKDRPNVRRP